MPEARSALASFYHTGRSGAPEGPPGLRVAEVRGRDIVQLASWPDAFGQIAGPLSEALSCTLPADCRRATGGGEVTVLLVGPERLWIVAPESQGLHAKLATQFTAEQAVVTSLGHGRTILRIAGPSARSVLAKGLPVDIDEAAFPSGAFAQSLLEEISALVHRQDDEAGGPVFDLYVSRSFAHAAFEWLVESAAEFGCQVEDPV